MTHYRRRKYNIKHTFLRLVVIIGVMAVGVGMVLESDLIYREGQGKRVKATVQENYKKAMDRAGEVMGEWSSSKQEVRKPVQLKVAIISDSQGDGWMLEQILQDISKEQVETVFHLGDITKGGELAQFGEAKRILDQYQQSTAYKSYVTLPGDHDFNWEPQHSLKNFKEVLGVEQLDRVVGLRGARFIVWDNANRALDEESVNISRREWLRNQVAGEKLVLVLTHRPLYSPYFKSRVDPRGRDVLKLLWQAAQESGVKVVVFSGDTHSYARYSDSETGIENVTVGAVGSYKNFLPMWTLLTVYEDGSFDIQPKPLTDWINR